MKLAFKYKPGQVVGYRRNSLSFLIGNSPKHVTEQVSGKIKLCATYHGSPLYLLDNGDTLAEGDIYCVYEENREGI